MASTPSAGSQHSGPTCTKPNTSSPPSAIVSPLFVFLSLVRTCGVCHDTFSLVQSCDWVIVRSCDRAIVLRYVAHTHSAAQRPCLEGRSPGTSAAWSQRRVELVRGLARLNNEVGK